LDHNITSTTNSFIGPAILKQALKIELNEAVDEHFNTVISMRLPGPGISMYGTQANLQK
jgi:hypothetical protein